ncbi:hypothetical protein IG631_19769 [Alternaria alternata]|nr:hypothetical protein IG631_19769 [Alternaria alternata]
MPSPISLPGQPSQRISAIGRSGSLPGSTSSTTSSRTAGGISYPSFYATT